MKKIVAFLISLTIAKFTFAQSTDLKVITHLEKYSKNDTIPKVVYEPEAKKILIEINDKLYSYDIMFSKIDSVESVNVTHGNFENNGKNYQGKVSIITKHPFEPNLITVNQLIGKYTTLNNNDKYIYSINGKMINSDENETFVDENHIMKITVIKLDDIKNIDNMNFIQILTRTGENLKKANQILIRGDKEDI